MDANESLKPARRKRGGQPGNKNRLKHGFYAHSFDPLEDADLDTMVAAGLQDEVAMLRVVIRRLFDLSRGCRDLDEMINSAGALGMLATRLAGMLRTQKILNGGDEAGVTESISRALADIVDELKLKI